MSPSSPTVAHRGREPPLEHRIEILSAQRLREVVVHPGAQASLAVARKRVGRHRDDRHVTIRRLVLANPRGRLVAVEVRHLAIHEDREVTLRIEPLDSLEPVVDDVDSEAAPAQHGLDHELVDRVVLGDEDDARARRPPRRRARLAGSSCSTSPSTSASVSSSAARRTGLVSDALDVRLGAAGAGRGQHHQPAGVQERLGADRAGDVGSAHLGHLGVEQHEVVGPPAARRHLQHHERRRPALGVVADGDATPQVRAHDLAVGGVVVDDEHARVLGQPGPRAPARALGVDHDERDLEPERAAAAGLGLGRQLAAHDRDQPARDREPQPGAAEPPRGRGVGLRERLEQLRELLWRDPDPGIAHLHAQSCAAVVRALGLDPHRHLAHRR